MIAAMLGALRGPLGATLAKTAAMLLLLVGIYQAGASGERSRGEAATWKQRHDTVLADRRHAEAARLSAEDKAATLIAIDAKLQEELNALRTALATRPETDRCPVSGADLKLVFGDKAGAAR